MDMVSSAKKNCITHMVMFLQALDALKTHIHYMSRKAQNDTRHHLGIVGTIQKGVGSHSNTNNTDYSSKNIYIVVPYIRGLSEKFRNTCKNVGIQVHFKGNNTIWTLIIAPKDKATCARKVELSTITNDHMWTFQNNT